VRRAMFTFLNTFGLSDGALPTPATLSSHIYRRLVRLLAHIVPGAGG
jgi:hypothetical protein